MLRDQKQDVVEKARETVQNAAGVLFLDFTGMTVAEADTLRGRLREKDLGYMVIKNTLLARAMADTPYADAAKCLKGSPTGMVVGSDDPVSAAKVAKDFMKECDHVRIKGGVAEGNPLDAAQAESLAKMKTKDEMQAEIVAQVMSPGSKLAAQFGGPASRIAGAIAALVEKLEGSETD